MPTLSQEQRWNRHYEQDQKVAALEVPIFLPIGDETTALTVLDPAYTFRMPYAFNLTGVKMSVAVAPTDASLVVDIKQAGTTVLGGKLTIDATEKTSLDSAQAEVLSTGSVELTGGASGSVDGITVNSIEVMSGAVNFDTDLDTTAGLVAANITANTSAPNYTAVAVGAVITISAIAGSGAGPNTFAVVSSTTTITTTDTNFSGGVWAQATIATSALANDDEITVEIIQIGSTVAGAGLKLWLLGTRA
jgi:hypothetical protein